MKKIFFITLFMVSVILGKAQQADISKSSAADTAIIDSPQVKPEFPGGLQNFYKYLGKIVRYPATAREDNVQGKVILKMVIEKDGSITNLKVVKSVRDDLDKEVLRVIAASPEWTPGRLNDKPVRCYYIFPFTFTLSQ